MSGLARAVTWTQRVGYSYPASNFQAALKATFPKLSDREVVHCLNEHERATAEWNTRIWGHEFYDFTPDPHRPTRSEHSLEGAAVNGLTPVGQEDAPQHG